MKLIRKVHKEMPVLSSKEMKEKAFIAILKEAESDRKGSLKKVKARLAKVMLAK